MNFLDIKKESVVLYKKLKFYCLNVGKLPARPGDGWSPDSRVWEEKKQVLHLGDNLMSSS